MVKVVVEKMEEVFHGGKRQWLVSQMLNYVKRGLWWRGVVLGVFKTLLGEIHDEVMGEKVEKQLGSVVELFAFGWLLEKTRVTWAHLEKKQMRVRLYTKSLEEIIIQTVEMTSPAIATTSGLDQDDVRIFKMAYGRSRLKINPRRFIEAAASRIL
nr:hypothetical protein [Tanacetum cinerariifolium]